MAGRVRRVIRRVPPPLSATIDDQLWPINVVLLILGGFVSGEVLVFGDFTTPAVLNNGWTWLSWVWFAVFGTMLLAWKWGGRLARRTQLSGALALLLTACLFTACYYFEIFKAVEMDDAPRDVVQREELVLPDFVQLQEIQRQQIQLEHLQPAETEVAQQEEAELEPQTVDREPTVHRQAQQAEPDRQRVRQAEAAPRQQAVVRQSPPRQADTVGRISRQVQPSTVRPDQVAVPQVAAARPDASAEQADASSRPLARRPEAAASPAPRQRPTPTTPAQQPPLATARRPNPTAAEPQLATSQPTLRRAVRQPVEMPLVPQVGQSQPAGRATAESREGSPAPAVPRPATPARRQPAPAARLAVSPPQEVARPAPAPSASGGRPRHAAVADTASSLPRSQPQESPRRTHRPDSREVSPVAVSSPATVQASQPQPDPAHPRATALSLARRGVAGVGAQRNLDRGDPAPRTVSEVASASARRSRATSETPDPTQLTTSRQARVAKDRAMAQTPAATLEAQSSEVAVSAGASEPGVLNATSSAAVRNSAAAQNPGTLTADAGSTDYDTGPTQIAAELGTGRAAGGGEPELHHATQTPDASRLTPPGGDPLAALDTQAVAPEPVARPAEGGGRPAGPVAERQSSVAAVTREASRAETLARRPVEVAEAGMDLPSGVAAARPRQMAPSEAAPDAVASGSTVPAAAARGVSQAAPREAEAPAVVLSAGGLAAAEGVEAASEQPVRQAGSPGVRGVPQTTPTGAAPSDVALNVPAVGGPGSQGGLGRATADGGAPGPAVAAETGRGPRKPSRPAEVPPSVKVAVDQPATADGGPQAAPAEGQVARSAEGTNVARRQSGRVQVLARAEEAAGGIGLKPSAEVGHPSRKAQRTSDVVTLTTDARFQQRDVGGPLPTGDTRARDPQAAFEQRKQTRGGQTEPGARPRHLEVAIRSGLEFLRLQQSDNGSWSFHNFPAVREMPDEGTAQIHADTAATGLALMCFLGAGYDHFDFGGQYAGEVQLAVDFLIENQQEDGNLYVDQDTVSSKSAALYSHAIATMALCEAYGMTRDPRLKGPARQAIAYIEATQHPERGGWRYLPGSSSDLSVTGWMYAALKSGQLAGLAVSPQTLEAALGYLDLCQGVGGDGSRYVYNPHAPLTAHQRQGRDPSRSMTAVGLLIRLYQGWDRSHPQIRSGADYLLEQLPQYRLGQRDTYYWYYATQVLFHMRGHYWETWQRRLHELLRETQVQEGPLAGSWDPQGPIPDRWGSHGGRIYVTTLNLLSLEVAYRYLPLYVEVE